MADKQKAVKRLLHIKLRALADPAHVLALLQSATPFYRAFSGGEVRFLQNVDEPAQFLIEIAYEADAALELNRQQVMSNPAMRSMLQGWRQMLAGSAEMDVFADVTGP
jgi:hypothetical protein